MPPTAELVGFDESKQHLREKRYVLVESQPSVRSEPILGLQIFHEQVEILRGRRECADCEIADIAGAGIRADQPRLRQQIFELQKKLGRIVPRGMKRKRLWENSLKTAFALSDLKTHFTRVERQTETEGELEPLDP